MPHPNDSGRSSFGALSGRLDRARIRNNEPFTAQPGASASWNTGKVADSFSGQDNAPRVITHQRRARETIDSWRISQEDIPKVIKIVDGMEGKSRKVRAEELPRSEMFESIRRYLQRQYGTGKEPVALTRPVVQDEILQMYPNKTYDFHHNSKASGKIGSVIWEIRGVFQTQNPTVLSTQHKHNLTINSLRKEVEAKIRAGKEVEIKFPSSVTKEILQKPEVPKDTDERIEFLFREYQNIYHQQEFTGQTIEKFKNHYRTYRSRNRTDQSQQPMGKKGWISQANGATEQTKELLRATLLKRKQDEMGGSNPVQIGNESISEGDGISEQQKKKSRINDASVSAQEAETAEIGRSDQYQRKSQMEEIAPGLAATAGQPAKVPETSSAPNATDDSYDKYVVTICKTPESTLEEKSDREMKEIFTAFRDYINSSEK